jgi:hypothetical protein
MQIYGIFTEYRGKCTENRGKCEENRGIFEENAGKIGEFPRNPFLEVSEPKGDPAVVSSRFQSFLVVFCVIPGYDSE